jgi:hypothetical protein
MADIETYEDLNDALLYEDDDRPLDTEPLPLDKGDDPRYLGPPIRIDSEPILPSYSDTTKNPVTQPIQYLGPADPAANGDSIIPGISNTVLLIGGLVLFFMFSDKK